MKLIALLFAILAIVPQALRGMAWGLARMSDCTLPTTACAVGPEDQSYILNLLWGPNWFTTTGLWIGGGGLAAMLVIMKIVSIVNDRRSRQAMDRADRQAGTGHGPGRRGGQSRDRRDNPAAQGRMPRPPAFDKYGRPRE